MMSDTIPITYAELRRAAQFGEIVSVAAHIEKGKRMDCSNARERIGDLDDDLWRLEWVAESGVRCTQYYDEFAAANENRNKLQSLGLQPTLRRYRSQPDETIEPWQSR